MLVTPENGDGGALADVEAGFLKLIHVAARAADETGILKAATEGVARLLRTSCVALVAPVAGLDLRIVASSGPRALPADAIGADWTELGADPMVRSAVDGASVVVEREPAFGSPDALLRLLSDWESIRSAAAVPLTAGAETIGALALYSDDLSAFDMRQTDALQWFARAIASEISRRRELSAARAERRRPDSPRISRSLDPREVARSIAQATGEFAGAAFAITYTLERETLTAAGGWKEPGEMGSALLGMSDASVTMYPPVVAAREQHVVRVSDVANDPVWLRHGWERLALAHGFTEVVAIPLVTGVTTVGAVALFFGIPPESEADDEVLIRLGFQGAEALMAARRFGRTALAAGVLDRLLAVTSDAVIEVDDRGYVTRWNEGAERMFGVTASRALGTSFVESPAVPEERREDVRETLSRLERGESARSLEIQIHNRDGHPIELLLAPIPSGDSHGDGFALVAFGRDASASRQTVDHLRRQNHALGVMRDVARTFAREVGLAAIVHKGLDKVLEAAGFDAGRVYLYASDTRQLAPIASRGFAEGLARPIIVPASPTGEESAAAFCVLYRQTVVLGQHDVTRIDAPVFEQHDVDELSVAISKPLLVGDATIGVIQVASFADRAADFENQSMFHAVADELAFAIHNAQLLEESARLAITDPLTGLYNYRFTQDFLKKRLLEARRRKRPFSIIMADVDHLQSVNERVGRSVGDDVLREVARSLAACVRGSDVVARYGGDEFIVVLPETQLGEALMLADRLTAALADVEWPAQLEEEPITVSMGCASFPEAGSQVNMLLRAADAALFQAKRSGASSVHPRFD